MEREPGGSSGYLFAGLAVLMQANAAEQRVFEDEAYCEAVGPNPKHYAASSCLRRAIAPPFGKAMARPKVLNVIWRVRARLFSPTSARPFS